MNKNALKVISTIMSACADVSYKVSVLIFLFMYVGRSGIKLFIRTAESYIYYRYGEFGCLIYAPGGTHRY